MNKLDLKGALTRQRILDGAREVFFLNGYAGASIDQIISQAGVSKGSLYHHFARKDALFRSLVSAEAERIVRTLPDIDLDNPDPASVLRQTGMAMLESLNNSATVATLRLIIGALSRFPNLGEEFLRESLGQTRQQLATYLDTRKDECEVEIGNCHAAAEEFTRQCLMHVTERILVPNQAHPTEAECISQINDVVRNAIVRRRNVESNYMRAGSLPNHGWQP
ncbi:TetR/AcrR family transcriptional regulator [Pannonibacter sp.]|uniref:TetR/AcrR family transcriptional regulator n=1 Tax=Pannonibacter sp. TaxID=1906786 RepID=UPI003F7202CD